MNEEIRVELLKLTSGERLLRLEHTPSGLCLEKRLDAEMPVVVQTGRWRKVFAPLLARELLPPDEPDPPVRPLCASQTFCIQSKDIFDGQSEAPQDHRRT